MKDAKGLVYSAWTRCRCGAGLCYDEGELREIRAAFERAGRREDVVRDSDGRVLSMSSRPNMPDEELEKLRARDHFARAWWCDKVLREQIELADAPSREEAQRGAPHGFALDLAWAVKDATGQVHDVYPFWCYEIKSEQQPSARGATTRPSESSVATNGEGTS